MNDESFLIPPSSSQAEMGGALLTTFATTPLLDLLWRKNAVAVAQNARNG